MTVVDSRRFAHDLVDLLFDHVEGIESRPVTIRMMNPRTEAHIDAMLDALREV